VAACRQPGVSIAAAAMARLINANLLRRWVAEAERAQAGSLVMPKPVAAAAQESFVALPVAVQSVDDTPIRIEVRRGTMTLSLQWPRSALHECALWLREVLK
jgi:transposase